jgi:hypothetical protein
VSTHALCRRTVYYSTSPRLSRSVTGGLKKPGERGTADSRTADNSNAGGMASGVCSDTDSTGEVGPAEEEPTPNVAISCVRPGILRIVLQPQSRISPADGALASARLLALGDGKRVGVLLEITGVESVSKEAVAVYSEASTVAAFALLGRSPVDKVIAHGLRGLAWPECPVRYFVDEREALTWLAGHC